MVVVGGLRVGGWGRVEAAVCQKRKRVRGAGCRCLCCRPRHFPRDASGAKNKVHYR